jgi:hypothetical protein
MDIDLELQKIIGEASNRHLSKKEIEYLTKLATSNQHRTEWAVKALIAGGSKAAFNLRFANKLCEKYNDLMIDSRRTDTKKESQTKKKTVSARKRRNRKIEITDHAVERYITRHEPGLLPHKARAKLFWLVNNSKKMKEKTRSGTERLISPGGVVLVIKRDVNRTVVVTVAPNDQDDCPGEESSVM